MKALQITNIGAPLEEMDVPLPIPGPLEVRVKVRAAGICHSDVHYRNGNSPTGALPITPGHEVAGEVDAIGDLVTTCAVGDRVCLHYLVTCGTCSYCKREQEQFCLSGQMIGKHRDGGYAEYVCLPERSVFHLPDAIEFAPGAIMMCSTSTSFHALNKARMKPGESVAVFGIGGLGFSAIQLAFAMGASAVYAVDLRTAKLNQAEALGAIPIDAHENAVEQILKLTDGAGVDVALELVGLPQTMEQATKVLGIQGRAALAGITSDNMQINGYLDLIGKEAEVMGVSDHLAREIPDLLNWAVAGKLQPETGISNTVSLDVTAVNQVYEKLEQFGEEIRTVILM